MKAETRQPISTPHKPVGRDYDCFRQHLVAAYRKGSWNKVCWEEQDMSLKNAVVALTLPFFNTYKVSLDRVSCKALEPWIRLPENTPDEKAFKLKIEKLIAKAIKDEINPVTGFKLDKNGLTRIHMQRIIKFCKTGNHIPDFVEKKVYYRPKDLDTLDEVLSDAKRRAPPEKAKRITELERRLINDRLRLLLSGKI